MAKNSIDSKVSVVDRTHVRKEGRIVSVSEKLITFKHRKRGGNKMITMSYLRDNVVAYGDDFIVVVETAEVSTRVFRAITGGLSEDKFGFYTVDGVTVNPLFGRVYAEEANSDKPAPAAKAKKKKAK